MPITVIFVGDAATDPFVVLDKTALMPCAPLTRPKNALVTALDEAARLFPQILAVRAAPNRPAAEHGLVHRLDTGTSGLVLLALTQDAYDFFLAEQFAGRFVKEYTAHCDRQEDIRDILAGFPPFPPLPQASAEGTLRFEAWSRFRSWGRGRRAVRPVTPASGRGADRKGGGRGYVTEMALVPDGDRWGARCTVTAGFRHQVRCHLAWAGFPVAGDGLYNPRCRPGEPLAFTAAALHFRHPVTGEQVDVGKGNAELFSVRV
jgi:23S rRNA pseudouridine1911/1915/1917 synthase